VSRQCSVFVFAFSCVLALAMLPVTLAVVNENDFIQKREDSAAGAAPFFSSPSRCLLPQD
jgi:hypothetical protein